MKYKLVLLVISMSFYSTSFASDQKMGLAQILKIAEKKYNFSELSAAKRDVYERESMGQSAFDNPVISYGLGRLKYNGGTGLAHYDEISISQNIPLNGFKTSVRRQGVILGTLGELEGTQSLLSLSSSVLLAAIKYSIAKQKFEHIAERRNFFLLVSQFLKSRKYSSPQKQIEMQLVENKLEEVLLETKEVTTSLASSKEVLKLFIGEFEEKNIAIHFMDVSTINNFVEKISKNDLLETKKFLQKEQYFKIGEIAAGRKWIPDLQVYYNHTNEHFAGGNNNQVIGLGIEVPLFNVGKNRKEAILAQKSVAEIEYEMSKNQSLVVRKSLLKNIQVGLDYISTYDEKKILSKERALRKFERDFEKGLVSAVNFLEFEDRVHMLHNRRLESQYEIFKSLLGLIELTGDESSLKEIL